MINYIGEKEVKGFSETGDRTPGGSTMVKVEYVDGSSDVMSHTRYLTVVGEEKLDATQLRDKLAKRVASMIYGVLHEYDVKLGEVDFVLDNVATLVNGAIERATNHKFGVEYADQRTLIMINNILLEANNDGASPTGSGSDSKN